ncbi:MAG: diacylglycerol/lipid kinase family protein [Anaerolineales bacterium]
MDRRVKLIFNHHADNGRGWRIASALQATIEHMGGAEWTGTEYPTHATELALEASEQGFDVVVAIGGDGTVHEVINGLMQVGSEKRPMLAAVPIGNGNDFSANAGVESDPTVAIVRAFTGEPRGLDIGMVRDGSGRVEYWDNVLGIGFDAAAVINSQSITSLQGTAMYFVAAVKTILRDHHAPHFKIRTESEEIDNEFLMVALCNGRREGGGFVLAPEALPDDGVLNYATVEWVSRLKMFRLIPEFMRGTHERFKEVRLGEFRELQLESDHPLLIHTDGEIFANATNNVRELTVRVLPEAIRLIG